MYEWIRIDGMPATEISPHSPATYELLADGGCGQAEWTMSLSPATHHRSVMPGSWVDLMAGASPYWAGRIIAVDRTTWQVTAMGHYATPLLALDTSDTPTRDVGAAVNYAADRGWGAINVLGGVAGVAAGDATGNPQSVASLMDEYAAETGRRWGVDGARRLYLRADPTSPVWALSPGIAALGPSSADQSGRLFGRFLDSATGTYLTASAGVIGGNEEAVDLSEAGAMSAAQAAGILAAMLDSRKSKQSWVSGVEVGPTRLTTIGGTPASPLSVQAGDMVRVFGIAESADSGSTRDVVIGKISRTQGSPMLYLEPVKKEPTTAREVWAAA